MGYNPNDLHHSSNRSSVKGDRVEILEFGVFAGKVRKARVGRNPNKPEIDVPIPARSMVKFKMGKEMRAAG